MARVVPVLAEAPEVLVAEGGAEELQVFRCERGRRALLFWRRRHEFVCDSLRDWEPGYSFDPEPLAVGIALEKDGFTGLSDRDVEASEVEPEGLHVAVQHWEQFRA